MCGRAGGVGCRRLILPAVRSNDAAEVSGSFQETAPRKTAEHTVKHRDGGVDLVVANHRGGSESSMVVTTLLIIITIHLC